MKLGAMVGKIGVPQQTMAIAHMTRFTLRYRVARVLSRTLPGAVVALGLLSSPASAQVIAAERSTAYENALAAGYKAQALCEGVIAAGRTEAQVEALELRGIYSEYQPLLPRLKATVDRKARSVLVSFPGDLPPRRADWAPGLGCVLAPIGGTARLWPAGTWQGQLPAPADARPWPLGDGGIAPRSSVALAATIDKAFDRATYKGETVGVVVLRDGRIVGEKYASGFGPFVANRTWSVAKSIAGTLVGIAVQELRIDPQKPAQVPEWRVAGDPRRSITLDQLLRMSSGLHSDHYGNRTDAIYFGGTTVTEQAAGWPLEVKPGTRFRYANNDIMLAARAVRAAMNNDKRYARWPQRLFEPLGMQHTTAGTDWQGNFILSSQVYTTARDLARLGQLWLQDGVWQGKRLLPAGWMRYMTAPSGPQPAEGAGYGATMWLFGPKQGLPAGTYSAQGNRGQYVMVVPSQKLVIVRRGEDGASARFDIARFTADVIRDGQ
ncbi:6-aminohexanoate-dimer hydrolase [Sphingomonas mucosissima]|uniref:6-aminohexanoate-dimer hydrolase n=2 Tax=Sphingomonas mucosissima TaxID=370959 RepID=A0A245ZS72_9SPHN|nr:6-aminohexanoate-dimer hydrolase [Sphingomonas mucosissima]